MDIIYDIETYRNCFTLAAEHAEYPMTWCFEISDYKDDSKELVDWLYWLKSINARMVGFNNLGFDYPVIHLLMQMGKATPSILYDKAMAIIGNQDDENRWQHMVYPSDRHIEQLDLFKIHHFDNKARATSLKVLEFNMRSENISDLPFPVGSSLTPEQIAKLREYNAHDVRETKKFYHLSKDMIRFREELVMKHGSDKDWINFNDTKIGKEYFIMRLEAAGVQCYEFGPSGRQPRQTKRAFINLNEVIFPWLKFENPEFQRILDWLRQQTITETKGVFKGLIARVDGIDFVFGTGGIHASVRNETIFSNDEFSIEDIDVEGYYPSTAIAQRFKPAHFPDIFCDIYGDLKEQRKLHKKGTAENAMLKLASNGVYGDSNNKFSVFYDPAMTMSITLNGQLLLCLLVENLLKIPGLRIIQSNTDGITVYCPRAHNAQMHSIVQWWEGITKLKMDFAEYKMMCIRDVNSYLAVKLDGSIKRIGAYDYHKEHHQDMSAPVIPKVVEQVLVNDAPIRETVENWSDRMDFMLRVKVPRNSKLMLHYQGVDYPLENTQRYYVSNGGGQLVKVMPPLAKKPGEWRRIGVESGWTVCPCNDIKQATLPIDYEYYIREVEKLCLGVM